LPYIEFEEGSFSAILCSRVLHFLEGRDVQLSIYKMHRWLRLGGKAFLIVDTPYSGASADTDFGSIQTAPSMLSGTNPSKSLPAKSTFRRDAFQQGQKSGVLPSNTAPSTSQD
jgi:hypothetical protein